MHTKLFFDTETTGLPLFKEPSDHPDQPHIVQLAACLVDLDTRRIISSMDVIVHPRGWFIPDDVAAIHGITTVHAMDVGVREEIALEMFHSLWSERTRIAHNEPFDARIIRIAQLRYNFSQDLQERWKDGKSECTQRLATPILKLPPTDKMKAVGRFHHKSANLGESVQHFTGKPLVNAHSAMADVLGCMAVYFAIQDLVDPVPDAEKEAASAES